MKKEENSVIQRYSADSKTSQQWTQKSLDKIQELKVPSNPVHFTLMYELLSQADPYFGEEVERLIREQNYDNETAEKLYITLITQILYKALPAEKACKLLNDLLSTLENWIQNSKQRQEKLDAGLNNLNKLDLPQAVSDTLFNEVLPNVNSIVNDTQHLEKEVVRTSEEVRLLKEELERTTTIAKTDELTNIPNRRGFNEIIKTLSQNAQEQQASFAIILLDLDHFKQVNDTFGHLIGDSVLRYIAKLLHKETKGQDSIARFGGEEFVVLLPDTQYDAAIRVANNIRTKINARPLQIKTNQQTLSLSISAGVAMYQMGEDLDKLFHRVDQCLYKAKTSGRNRVCGESEL